MQSLRLLGVYCRNARDHARGVRPCRDIHPSEAAGALAVCQWQEAAAKGGLPAGCFGDTGCDDCPPPGSPDQDRVLGNLVGCWCLKITGVRNRCKFRVGC